MNNATGSPRLNFAMVARSSSILVTAAPLTSWMTSPTYNPVRLAAEDAASAATITP